MIPLRESPDKLQRVSRSHSLCVHVSLFCPIVPVDSYFSHGPYSIYRLLLILGSTFPTLLLTLLIDSSLFFLLSRWKLIGAAAKVAVSNGEAIAAAVVDLTPDEPSDLLGGEDEDVIF